MKWAGIWHRIWPGKIIIYADFIDPFCYIGFHNLRRAAEAARIPLDWRGFELNPETPAEGSHLLTTANSDLRPGMWASVSDYAKKSGLVLAEPDFVPNTRRAHLWLKSIKNGVVKNSLIERIYQAYLSNKLNIGKVDVLAEIAKETGMPIDPFLIMETEPEGRPLETYRTEAIQHRFTGMPGFRFRGKTFFGALSEEAWRTIMKESVCLTK